MDVTRTRPRSLWIALLAVVLAMVAAVVLALPAKAMADDTLAAGSMASADADSSSSNEIWGRLAGDTALDTMTKIVNEGWPKGSDTVVLTTQDGYWDALTASGIAGQAKAPILMTDTASLSSQTKDLLASLKPTKVIVAGGTAVIPEAVATAAKEATGVETTVLRAAGDDAIGTANVIAGKMAEYTGGKWADTAFVCTNDGYWDALAAAPLSYANGSPIFLADGHESMTDATLTAMSEAGVKNVYLVGGEAALTPAVQTQLEGKGFTVTKRLGGATAIETSEAVATEGIDALKLDASNLGIATMEGYWDALTGAPLVGLKGGVLVLVNKDGESDSITNFIANNKDNIHKGYIFGGTAAISESVEKAVEEAAPGSFATISFVVPEGTDKPADQTIPTGVMIRDAESYGSSFALPEIVNADGDSIFWYTDKDKQEPGTAVGPKTSFDKDTTLYGKFQPYFMVNIVKADGKTVTKSYTKKQFAALAEGSKDLPMSAMWNYNSDTKGFSVSTSISYVTMESLVRDTAGTDADALAVWDAKGATITYAAADASNSRTVADLKAGKFYGTDDGEGTAVQACFGLNWTSGSVTSETTAAAVQKELADQLDKKASTKQAPRTIFGLTDKEYANKKFPKGMQMLSNVMSITLEVPAEK